LTSISSGAERRRRILTRALPLVVLAVIAFVAGISVGGGSPELDAAKRFLSAWEEDDYEAMHAELTPATAADYPIESFTNLYEKAKATATATAIDSGEAEGPSSSGDDEVVKAPATARTNAFGEVRGTVAIPVADAGVAWQPNLVFPGLEPGEELDRKTRAPERAAILAADGTPLAKGPSAARTSPLGSSALDIAGEMGTPKRAERETTDASGFPAGTLVGTSGLELAFDERLAGKPGGQLLAVGEGERVLADTDPQPGQPVKTTIEPGLQETTVNALGGQLGGVAVLDATNGQVKALAGIAFSSPQPPGSVFKIITTTAALESGAVSLDDQFDVATEAVVDGRAIANAGDEPCGGSFTQSFADSCNSVFAPLGAEVGGEKLLSTAEDFGFNSPPELYDEQATAAVDPPPSSIPDPIGSDLDVAVTAIGQGQVLATPLQMANVSQTIANEGKRSPTPLVTEPELAPDAGTTDVTDAETANKVRDLMIANVETGTGVAADIPEAQVAGKTGTAELGPDPDAPAPAPGESPALQENAWFTAFAPADNPKLAIAVMLVDASGSGGEVAAPIAAAILSSAL
jgi:cell division protein FtsI/penicillin-binding protein 2